MKRVSGTASAAVGSGKPAMTGDFLRAGWRRQSGFTLIELLVVIAVLGDLAGFRRNSSVDRAVYWDQYGIMQDIGTLGGAEATARSINDGGYVVGWANTGSRNKNMVVHAFLWDSSTGMRDLNALKSTADTSGLELTSASKINNAGQILALGSSKTLGTVPVLLHPQ